MINKNTQIIIDKCHILLSKGYSLEYCLKRFKRSEKEIRDYFRISEEIGVLKKAKPSKQFREKSLDLIIARVEEQKEQDLVQYVPTTNPRRLILKPAIIFLAFIVISVFSFSGTLFASQDSLPGEPLYPLKRSFEEFRLNIYPESLKGGLHLKYLDNRIEEAEIILSGENNIDSVLIDELIYEMDRQYRFCKQYNCIDQADEGKILDSIEAVKKNYRNRFGKDSGNTSNSEQESMGQQGKDNDTHEKNGPGQGSGKNGQGSGNGSGD